MALRWLPPRAGHAAIRSGAGAGRLLAVQLPQAAQGGQHPLCAQLLSLPLLQGLQNVVATLR